MSTSNPSFPQMSKVFDTFIEKGVTTELLQDDLLGRAILADVAEATVAGTIPSSRDEFRKSLGLDPLELPKPVYLRQLYVGEEIIIGPTDGTRTIAQAKDVFTGGIDSNFANLSLDVTAQPTGEIAVAVNENISNGEFSQIFGSVGYPQTRPGFTQHQIIEFCVKHKDRLRQGGYGTFFPFQVNGKFYVAYVAVGTAGRLYVRVDQFSNDSVWNAKYQHRFVIPKLTVSLVHCAARVLFPDLSSSHQACGQFLPAPRIG
ncbi:MAG: hypothetical protein A3J06_04770 [Candidatus Moranbacteria bacterium RIFCSPLOWO2_02_FULL_48_19]|nr:MAG: hypothetical protein A3J06_04770 [Candidatus Moranbacteria bacterium RIFCSPLOWO2_02_FULL_48_19]